MINFSYLQERPDPSQQPARVETDHWFVTEDSKPLPSNRFGAKHRRNKLRRQLMEKSPFCSHCGMQLTTDPSRHDQAHLVRDRLSCHEHVKLVRRVAIAEQCEQPIELTDKGQQFLKSNPIDRKAVRHA